ncbi:phosphatidylglycerophosphatase and protein-tyrosine phosphatase 1-like isoform X1 [Coregonus clupeaformis]|uniref:phosphatidylglycerophosphatase and protein-tyrosine phosphatase 1-like isoform X1 n=1 Tax=Coregonus clupeaformis TaxID=59861 RepID=UPI001BE1242E|nr:phosphatidylglycerophosphatase and protein-tyrosine phosphatase 1-like isoform X1 [Coregonus clupeaformis]
MKIVAQRNPTFGEYRTYFHITLAELSNLSLNRSFVLERRHSSLTSLKHRYWLVQTENVRGVITMNEEYETKYFCNSAEEWKAEGVEQLRLSTVDLTGVPSLENLHRGVEFALSHREKGSSVYVHCKAGRCRSATLAAAYIIRIHCWSPEEACQMLASVRPHVIIRSAQLEMLRRYHQQVCGGGSI